MNDLLPDMQDGAELSPKKSKPKRGYAKGLAPQRYDSVSLFLSVKSLFVKSEEVLNIYLEHLRQLSERCNRSRLPTRLNVDNLNSVDAGLTREVTLRKLTIFPPNCERRFAIQQSNNDLRRD